jgi:hypothetical protein
MHDDPAAFFGIVLGDLGRWNRLSLGHRQWKNLPPITILHVMRHRQERGILLAPAFERVI